MAVDPGLLTDLQSRGLVEQMTGEAALIDHFSESRAVYCGFDPTADSLHIGSLVPLLTLKRFQQAGHKPIALLGGATGLIGDPSFKAQERKLNSSETVVGWVDKLRKQVSRFIAFEATDNAAIVVNNLHWMDELSALDFLRKIGKHFSINNMINKDSVKQRINREGEGISFTEFSYMLLQSYDFSELYRNYNCTVQIGGSDQWGNIVSGVELTRRLHGGHVYGLTLPLVTKADGAKFGKTESGTIWLDPSKTSPYAFYQFWLNTADADVYKFLRFFTFLELAEIDVIERADCESLVKPQAQRILAEEVTRLVHGDEAFGATQRITDALFKDGIRHLSSRDMEQLQQDGLPSTSLNTELLNESLATIFVNAGLAKNGKQVKDALLRCAALINDQPIGWKDNMSTLAVFDKSKALFDRYFIVRLGKKSHHLFVLD
ncbi:MAG: tyrosyl-tRNA synthetase [Cellvibrionaceae bacterium]